MSATSGIGVSQSLADAFAAANTAKDVRFLKISIQNEALVLDESISKAGTVEEDMHKLQDLIQDNIPVYVLTCLDDGSWIAIFYVPDSAKVRDKMLYASTRNNLTKALGASHFADTLFATTRSDLTPDAYTKHRAHLAAPPPMSEREREVAAAREAERTAGYGGAGQRASHLGTVVGMKWADEATAAVADLASGDDSRLVLLTIDAATETVTLVSSSEVTVDALGGSIPADEPSYSFFAWSRTAARRDVVFIYACPSASPVRNRMLYSSGARGIHSTAASLLPSGGAPSAGGALTILSSRKVETSEPRELGEAFLTAELGDAQVEGSATPIENKPAGLASGGFARPKGPGRKR